MTPASLTEIASSPLRRGSYLCPASQSCIPLRRVHENPWKEPPDVPEMTQKAVLFGPRDRR